MTWLRLIAASLIHHAKIHFAVALGVAAATAVLTGALLVGDSLRGSLRHITLDRLGKIDELLLADRFFRRELAEELAQQEAFKSAGYREVVPAILLPNSSLENTSADHARASNVLTIGCAADFSKLNANLPAVNSTLKTGQIVLNAPLAKKLSAQVGHKLTLRFPAADQVPADSPLAKKSDRSRSIVELEVVAIIPAAGLGRFSLHPQQVHPLNAFVAQADVQTALEQENRVNALLVSGSNAEQPPNAAASQTLNELLQPTLADYGLRWEHVQRTFQNGNEAITIFDYYSLSSDRMLLDPGVVVAANKAFAEYEPQSAFTFLANRMERIPTTPGEKELQEKRGPISYSTLSAIDSAAAIGPCFDEQGKLFAALKENEILLTSWAAEDQQAKIGDRVRITYFEPETTHGATREAIAEFTVRGIVPLTEPAEPYSRRKPALFRERPTPANDPHLTPEVKGVTDQDSIAKWEAPFPVNYKLVRSQDDTYWENHRTTPKAYISLAAGQKLWGSRWGNVTSIRLPAKAARNEAALAQALLAEMRQEHVTLGLEFQPIKRQNLAASAGTTPFDVLFLGLSFFIVAASLLLVMLLFRLGVEQRGAELGVLLSVGWRRSQLLRLLFAESFCIALPGAMIGVLLGVGYAWLMLVGLRTWWLGAVSTPFLTLYISPFSLIVGATIGVLTSLLAIAATLRSLRAVSIRQLLAGSTTSTVVISNSPQSRFSTYSAALLLLLAGGLAFLAPRLGGGEAQAGAFLGAGTLVLVALFLLLFEQLRRGGTGVGLIGELPLSRLALRSAARNPSRSLLTLALVASAGFLIVALSAFRLDPTARGSGGFTFVAQSAQPLLFDLNREVDRQEFLADDAVLLAHGKVLPFRLQPGDDASCRNLYQAAQPRVLGVSPTLIEHYDQHPSLAFEWAGSAAATKEERANPWRLLAAATEESPAVPVVIDKNTAMYSLKLYQGIGEEFEIRYPERKVRFRVVGLLANSVLQGSLLIGEQDFKRLFPAISGHRYFLIEPNKEIEDPVKVSMGLENRLSDQGFEVRFARDVLDELLAVQNTYISTFQTLGALGLVLGTLGIAAVQLRSILERRSELGLLRAMGFQKRRLALLVMLENVLLLIGGLAMGVIAALIAVLPHMLAGGAKAPLPFLALLLGVVVAVGGVVGLITVRQVLRLPLLAALRGE